MVDRFAGITPFVDAAEAGSFTAAAARLKLSRSAIGKAVSRLERRLGTRLFHRTTRSQTLTEAGHLFYEHCQRALAELRAAEALLDEGRTDVAGRLRVTVPVLFGRHCVAPVLWALARAHPKLELELNFNDGLADFRDHGFDLAVRHEPAPVDGGLIASRRVSRQRMTVCASPSYLERAGRPRRLDDLARHRAVVFERDGRMRPWRFPRPGSALPRELTPPVAVRMDDLEAIADAVADGLGLGWLPCWLIWERVRSGALVPLLPSSTRLQTDFHVHWVATPNPPPRLRYAIEALVNGLPDPAE